jgi:hypothetical protein
VSDDAHDEGGLVAVRAVQPEARRELGHELDVLDHRRCAASAPPCGVGDMTGHTEVVPAAGELRALGRVRHAPEGLAERGVLDERARVVRVRLLHDAVRVLTLAAGLAAAAAAAGGVVLGERDADGRADDHDQRDEDAADDLGHT